MEPGNVAMPVAMRCRSCGGSPALDDRIGGPVEGGEMLPALLASCLSAAAVACDH